VVVVLDVEDVGLVPMPPDACSAAAACWRRVPTRWLSSP
jgi:hypothetical protein